MAEVIYQRPKLMYQVWQYWTRKHSLQLINLEQINLEQIGENTFLPINSEVLAPFTRGWRQLIQAGQGPGKFTGKFTNRYWKEQAEMSSLKFLIQKLWKWRDYMHNVPQILARLVYFPYPASPQCNIRREYWLHRLPQPRRAFPTLLSHRLPPGFSYHSY